MSFSIWSLVFVMLYFYETQMSPGPLKEINISLNINKNGGAKKEKEDCANEAGQFEEDGPPSEPAPDHYHWCPWSNWRCSVTCGEGTERRDRTCEKYCHGPFRGSAGDREKRQIGTETDSKSDDGEESGYIPGGCRGRKHQERPCHRQPCGQRCAGRNFGGRRCCTPENPCNEGEGDCDGPGDGGGHDGHAGCKDDLQCGSNNCKKFGTYYHEKDDCCEKPSSTPEGQRCAGRNFGGRRCCTPENPCNEGEGDCDGPGDGGGHDGHVGCKGDLECGSNNCKQFGTYYHEKDDCCAKPSSTPEGWSNWLSWSPCTKKCGGGTKTRHRTCHGTSCRHTQQSQERPCSMHPC